MNKKVYEYSILKIRKSNQKRNLTFVSFIIRLSTLVIFTMEKIHETPKIRENSEDLKELYSLLSEIFWEQFWDQINILFQSPEEFQNLAKKLIQDSLHHFLVENTEGVDEKLNFLTLEQKIEKSLEILGRNPSLKEDKTIPYNNSHISYSIVLKAFLIGMKDGIRQYRNWNTFESMNHIITP